MNMQESCRIMTEADIEKVIPLFIDHYNNYEDGEWTRETTYKRIHQVWSREDALCFVLESDEEVLGFVMGYFEQYDDIKAYKGSGRCDDSVTGGKRRDARKILWKTSVQHL